jgi:16S rRNA (guanine1207-N2)-methyltransferase
VRHQHYFTTRPHVASHPVPVRVALPDRTLELITDRGVFAHGHLDRGTELLLRSVPLSPDGELLDLGCGYGAIAITLALRAPQAHVWAVDINERAIELCERNAHASGATNVTVGTPDHVPESIRFSAIYSNPPVRLGKEPLHDVLDTWLARLRPDGVAWLVVQRHLGSDSLAKWLMERGRSVSRLRSKWGYRVLEVRIAPGSPHHGAHDRG